MNSMAGPNTKHHRIYNGWVVVAACFVIWAVAFGIQFSFGIFFKPLQDSFGWSRGATSWAMTIHLIVFALCMIPAGWAIDRFNLQILFSVAALLVGFSLVLCSRISEPWQLYLLYGLPLGVGTSICGPAIPTIITRWFTEKRGLALGITSAGVGFGILAAAPLSNILITAYGWRNTFIIFGFAGCIILLVCAGYIKNPPQSVTNQTISAVGKFTNHNRTRRLLPFQTMTFRQAIKTREILLIILASISANISNRMIAVHIAPHAMDTGISPSVAALAVATIGGFSLLGRMVMGFFQDKVGVQSSMVICLTTMGGCMIALPFIRSDLIFFSFASVFGFASGGDVPQVPAITAQCFGVASMGVIFGMVMAVTVLVSAFGPIVAGYIFDLLGSYTIVFWGGASILFLGAFSISRIRLRI